jgi:hypothetical protein
VSENVLRDAATKLGTYMWYLKATMVLSTDIPNDFCPFPSYTIVQKHKSRILQIWISLLSEKVL